MEKLKQLIRLFTCLLMVLAVAIDRDHKMFGHELAGPPQKMNETVSWKADGAMIIATKEIAKDFSR